MDYVIVLVWFGSIRLLVTWMKFLTWILVLVHILMSLIFSITMVLEISFNFPPANASVDNLENISNDLFNFDVFWDHFGLARPFDPVIDLPQQTPVSLDDIFSPGAAPFAALKVLLSRLVIIRSLPLGPGQMILLSGIRA